MTTNPRKPILYCVIVGGEISGPESHHAVMAVTSVSDVSGRVPMYHGHMVADPTKSCHRRVDSGIGQFDSREKAEECLRRINKQKTQTAYNIRQRKEEIEKEHFFLKSVIKYIVLDFKR